MAERESSLFNPMVHRALVARLWQRVCDAAEEFASAPGSYLRSAFVPDHKSGWLPVRLATETRHAASDLILYPKSMLRSLFAPASDWVVALALNGSTQSAASFIEGVFVASGIPPEPVSVTPRKRFRKVLTVSAVAHSVFIIYLVYLAILALIAPFTDIRVVNRAYRKLDTTEILGKLQYPPGMLRAQAPAATVSLDEIRERARSRREEQAKLQREREERERLEREKAERGKAEAERLAAENAKREEQPSGASAPTDKFGEINEAPIKDIVGKVYALYKEGGLDIQDINFTVMASFKIKRDGSLSDIKIIKSSGSKVIDNYATQILWNIGESHALGPIADLTSCSIQLELDEKLTRLTIMGFAPTPEVAQTKAQMLNLLFSLMRIARKSDSPDVSELLSQIKVKSNNKRVDAELSLSRERASEMMRAKFGK